MEQLRATVGDPVDQALARIAADLSDPDRSGSKRVRVLDVGGGSGTRAVPLAMHGCAVTVVDSSVNALAILHRRAADAGVADLVTGVQADADRLSTVAAAASVDLVLCHHVLEEVDDPAAVLDGVAAVVRPGGAVSVLIAGRIGAVLSQTLVGRFEQARQLLSGTEGRTGDADPLRRRLDLDQITALLDRAGMTVESVTGIGVLTALVSGAARQAAPGGEAELAALEAAAAEHPELLRIAADLHVVARRPGRSGASAE